MAEKNISETKLDLMLRRELVSFCTNDAEMRRSPNGFEARQRVNVDVPKSILDDDLSLLLGLLKNADADNSTIGKFIQYYQFFEYMISKIFEWGIPQVHKKDELTPWMVKERLEMIGGEKKRLHLLDSSCVPHITDRNGLIELRGPCIGLLNKIGVSFSENATWHSLLYKVRNSVVHNQILFLKSDAAEELNQVNHGVRRAALDLLFSFEKPADDAFFPEDKTG